MSEWRSEIPKGPEDLSPEIRKIAISIVTEVTGSEYGRVCWYTGIAYMAVAVAILRERAAAPLPEPPQ